MNSLKSFVFVLGACVGLPTYVMVIRPYAKERERQPGSSDHRQEQDGARKRT